MLSRYVKSCFTTLICILNSAVMTYAQSIDHTLIISTKSGKIEGQRETSGIISFKGIPYAAPPTDNNRWKAPQPLQPWKGILPAKKFGPRSMQPPIFGDMNFRSNGMSEDCLYLNVWTPSTSGKLPVLVYFYGGGFVAGDGSEPRYDGESMAQQGIVSLTVNYRLGIFGLLAHPELSKESPRNASGNYGLMDQAAALQWVKENIAAFGGDPNRITIAGESAGSVSVSIHMISPLSKHLIAAAIGESGSVMGTMSAIPLKEAEQRGLSFSASLNNADISALRKMPADKILEASVKFGVFNFPFTIDGHCIPREPLELFQAGEQAKIPLLVGWNSEEMNYRAILENAAPTKKNFIQAVKKLYGVDSNAILNVYIPEKDAEVEQLATDLAGDRFIGFSTWRWAMLHEKTGGNRSVYRYYYTKPRPPMRTELGNVEAGLAGGVKSASTSAATITPKGAVHSAEIEYAMGNLESNKVFDWTADDVKVSQTMQSFFANFIKTGNPNGKDLPHWAATKTAKPSPIMQIDVQSKIIPDQNTDRYEVLEKIYSKQK